MESRSIKTCSKSTHVHDSAGWPLEKVLSYLPTKELAKYPLLALGFVPPVNVKAVAKAAVAAATDSSVPAGAMDVWTIQKYDSSS